VVKPIVVEVSSAVEVCVEVDVSTSVAKTFNVVVSTVVAYVVDVVVAVTSRSRVVACWIVTLHISTI
jgi:hypothetical protein